MTHHASIDITKLIARLSSETDIAPEKIAATMLADSTKELARQAREQAVRDNALEELAAAHRDVTAAQSRWSAAVHAAHKQGCSQNKIADAAGCSRAWIAKLLARARA